MKLTVNRKNQCKGNKQIKECANYIYKNINLLNVIANLELIEDKDEITAKGKLEQGMSIDIISNALKSGYINNLEEGKKFVKSYLALSQEDRGTLLENIIFNLGPVQKELLLNSENEILVDVKVKETGLENDFDVAFFGKKEDYKGSRNYKLKIYGDIEFHECKKNITNVIPADVNCRMSSNFKNKLKFFKKVHDLRPDCNYYLPTYSADTDPQKSFLEDYESGAYNFLEILDIYEVIDLLS